MIRAILDANVVISGAKQYKQSVSPPARIVQLALIGAFEVFASVPLIAEIESTLNEPYFIQRVDAATRQEILAFMREQSLDDLSVVVSGVASHPQDDLILATAVAAAADVLVTGDRMLLKLGSYEGVSIISPSDFLAYLESQE